MNEENMCILWIELWLQAGIYRGCKEAWSIEAFFEIVPWAQLGMYKKPCGLLNICGYFKHLIRFLDTAVSEKFLRKEHREMIFIHESPEELIRIFTTYKPSKVAKWMELKN